MPFTCTLMYSFIIFLSEVRYSTCTDPHIVNIFILNEYNLFCNHNLLIRVTSGCLDGTEEWRVTAKAWLPSMSDRNEIPELSIRSKCEVHEQCIACITYLRVYHALSRQPYRRRILCVELDLWYGEFSYHHMLNRI